MDLTRILADIVGRHLLPTEFADACKDAFGQECRIVPPGGIATRDVQPAPKRIFTTVKDGVVVEARFG